ncbi:TPM domain-containing protein [Arcanobacterium hippocoleae]
MARNRILQIGASSAAALALLFLPQTAFAENPIELDKNFVDSANVIVNENAVQDEIMKVRGADLWVVVVKDFSGAEADAWTKKTFKLSGLQSHDGLVAISTGTRELGVTAGGKDGMTKTLLDKATNKEVLNLFKEKNGTTALNCLHRM